MASFGWIVSSSLSSAKDPGPRWSLRQCDKKDNNGNNKNKPTISIWSLFRNPKLYMCFYAYSKETAPNPFRDPSDIDNRETPDTRKGMELQFQFCHSYCKRNKTIFKI